MRRVRTIAVLVGVALAAGALAVTALGYALAHPVPARLGAPPLALRATSVAIPSASGSLIHGWLSVSPEHAGSVLLLPGVRANRSSMVDRALFLRDAKYSVLLIDFQGTGESSGEVITFGWRERLDVLAAVDFLRRELPGEPIVILGSSLGGAAALLATPPLHVDGLVIESVYPSIDRAAANRLRRYLGTPGVAIEPLLLAQLRPRIGVGPEVLRPVDHIGNVTCPLLVISGAKDEHTTVDDTRMLFAAAHEPKQLWLIDGAAHVDLCRAGGESYRRRILEFIACSTGRPAQAIGCASKNSAIRAEAHGG
jgi:pimeloyl-ACP methyl ester carboxylesterase